MGYNSPNPENSVCEEMGHGKLVYIATSKDGMESSYQCLECGKILTTLDEAFDLSEINIEEAEESEES